MLGRLMEELAVGAESLTTLARTGILAPTRPDKLARMGLELRRRGPLAAACSVAAIRYGDRPALIDELGMLSYREIDERSNALAHGWIADGMRSGDTIAILARNHRGFVESTFAAAKVGLRMVLMNTEFAGPQVADVCEREGAETLVLDAEYADRAPRAGRLFTAWSEDATPGRRAEGTLEELIEANSPAPVDPPSNMPTVVLLTSGTTGTPKGAPRGETGSLNAAGALLERVPFKANEATYVAPPVFHALGFAHLMLGFAFGSTVVTRRRFDPEAMLAGIAEHGCTALIAVPAMLQRTLELDPEVRARHDTSRLRIIFSGGSQLPGSTGERAARGLRRRAARALRLDRGCLRLDLHPARTTARRRRRSAGRYAACRSACSMTTATRSAAGESGRIFVSSGLEFAGYTDGKNKEVIDGLMSSGDVGHFDSAGRLFVDGRDDEMIVSGGENVFPQEVEELLLGHPEVADAAVIGVPDEDFGARLAAYVVAAADAAPSAELLRGTCARTSPATRCRARSTSSISCRATRPERCSSASSPRPPPTEAPQAPAERRSDRFRNMSHKPADRIRNVALVGHRGCGKTSVCEALLYEAGAINRLGKVDEGTTVCDSAADEQERGHVDRRGGLLVRARRPQAERDRHARVSRASSPRRSAPWRWSTPRWSSSTASPGSRSAPTGSGGGPPRPACRGWCSSTCSTASGPTSTQRSTR